MQTISGMETGQGDVALQFRFVPAEPTLRVDDIKLKLAYDGGEERIAVDAMGSFRIVPNDVAAKGDAHFVINKRRDDYRVAVDIAPNVPPEPLTVSEWPRTAHRASHTAPIFRAATNGPGRRS